MHSTVHLLLASILVAAPAPGGSSPIEPGAGATAPPAGTALARPVAARLPPSGVPGPSQARTGGLPPADTLSRPVPTDTYGDAGVRELLDRARALRGREVSGIESYEATLRERVYAGLSGRRFRRERSLFELEQVAVVRWSRSGERVVRWVGARREVPLADLDTSDEGMKRMLENELSRSGNPAAMAFDPGDDRLAFGSGWALHPLADTAVYRYRYRSGDTLRVRLPEQDRVVTMIEARVEPREVSFNLVSGSLWFDRESGHLVRAAVRPARPFDLELDEPDDARDVPRVLRPIRAEVRYIAIDYGLHDFQWWLPHRFAFEGEAQVGALFRMPITFEWTLGDYVVNEAPRAAGLEGPLPPGWSRSERRFQREGEPPRYVTIIVPPGDSLVASPELIGSRGGGATAFSTEELREIRRALDALAPPAALLQPRVLWGVQDGLTRYNRVEGLSTGARLELPVGARHAVEAAVRLGTADRRLKAELSLLRGPEEGALRLTAYRRLDHGADRSNPGSLPNSLQNLVTAGDRDPWFLATGVELEARGQSRRVRGEARLFHERNDAVARATDFHLLGLFRDDSAAANIEAQAGTVTGAEVGVRWWSGLDPARLRAFGSVGARGGAGPLGFARAQASLGVTRPLFGGVAGAVEVAGGTVFGDDTPVQRLFYGGDSPALRAGGGSLMEERWWTVRAELANELPVARLVLFGDLGWAGRREAFSTGRPSAAVGIGASLMDGVLRLDLSRGVRGRSDFYFRAYLDGLF